MGTGSHVNSVPKLHKEATKLIKVMVVEDSPVVREFLVYILGSDPGIRVVGTANNGEEALEAVKRYRPDVITMDIHMPKMDGLEATRRIMETEPVPIVIVSGSTDTHENTKTFRAMEAGALAVLARPAGIGQPNHESTSRELVQTVKLMSEVKVVRRWPQTRRELVLPSAAQALADKPASVPANVKVIALGASTGGPPVLQTILAMLPRDFPLPVLIVQHMASGFITSFVEWLAQSSGLPVHVAMHGELILPGHVYVAPDECQMKVERGGKIVLTHDVPENGLRPSVSYLFRSLAAVYGGDAVAGLLTGMGRDGAEELRLLREKGATTFAQDKDSSVVHGMPGEAIKLDAATFILAPDKIAGVLTGLANGKSGM
ncbi:MAG: Chemotaxis response regulator protein-glutamate methylesterase [Candidatus Gallionella acididurans]|uniref:Protein-glutamate methylesterase/protein-glutamine glutaminase n=1 Tax=Candidatus Gallionella acididurans TaxID=1796491 RepID=A0A139BQ87_9PROT|nr:MAG: Chemotaxis response regulator protein-glutamate methylesterase [Candidatus Gallionella acididurans]